MSASVYDSAILRGLYPTGEVGRLFSDSNQVRSMLLVEGALARAQGALGVIPEDSAAYIHRAAMEVQIDPGALTQATASNGVSVPALVQAFRAEMNAPEHAQYVHWGATSQDILDTGQMLRLRQALNLIEADLEPCLTACAELAESHADLPMAARTYGQHATPTTFGAVAAQWGQPLLGLLDELDGLRRDCLLVSLSGAAGTASALGPQAAETRAAMAEALKLNDPGRSWHTDRTPVLKLADWFARVTAALAKPGEDLTELVQTGIGEARLGGAGASSTMPQKQNPVAPSALVAIWRMQTGLMQVLQGAAVHRHQRDGAAWFTEWMCLPQIVLGAASAAQIAKGMLDGLTPNADAMAGAIAGGLDLIHAEAVSFALAKVMPRPEAQAETKRLCQEVQESGVPLLELLSQKWPDVAAQANLSEAGTGQASADARRFAEAVKAR
ncbi:MAG: adenylosuccinate lyase family protein [Paracoccaceae bacterium]